MKGISALVLVATTLSGCARWADTAQNFFVSSTPAVAVVGQQVVQGQLHVYNDNTGYIVMESDRWQEPVLRCSGRMPVTGSFSRAIDLRCNNGVQARLGVSMRSDLRGFAYGGEGEQSVSLVVGLEPSEVIALLKLPAQTRLALQDGRYQLTHIDVVEQASAAPVLPPAPPAEVKPAPMLLEAP